jgi:hypothetical protein
MNDGSLRRPRLRIIMLMLAMMATAADGVNVAPYSIAAIDYAPTPLQQVGKVQAGLLCLPKGKLRWRDVARPEQSALVARVEKALGVGGIAVAPQPDPLYGDPPPVTQYRIRVSVDAVSLKICTAGDVMFIGKVGRAPKTQGTISVRWETFDRAARVRIREDRFVMPVDDRDADARSTSRLLNDAIVESAVRYAASRKATD